MADRASPDSWQLFIDTTHDRGSGDYFDGSRAVGINPDAACFADCEPLGPWEPLGNGEWRRPLRFKVPE